MPLKVTITDYGVGNLYSIRRSLEKCGADVRIVGDMSEIDDAECIVFPGVGAFDATMHKMTPYRERIREKLISGTPALGICIGMQILFNGSDEGTVPGIGLYDGNVVKLGSRIKPHMGWNIVDTVDPLFEGVDDRYFYFVHSYRGSPADDSITVGTTEYDGETFPSFFRRYNTYGTQFHPEKSSLSGRKVLENFIEFAEEQL